MIADASNQPRHRFPTVERPFEFSNSYPLGPSLPRCFRADAVITGLVGRRCRAFSPLSIEQRQVLLQLHARERRMEAALRCMPSCPFRPSAKLSGSRTYTLHFVSWSMRHLLLKCIAGSMRSISGTDIGAQRMRAFRSFQPRTLPALVCAGENGVWLQSNTVTALRIDIPTHSRLFKIRFVARSISIQKSSRPDDAFRIAVHVRRGDVTAQAYAGRFTSTELIGERVERLLRLCGSRRSIAVTVFSEGPISQFEPLRKLGCEIRCDDDPIDTIRHLARADILVTAKSSFSYVAGLLTQGLVVYEPFWHPKQPSWMSLDDWRSVEQAVQARLALA